MSWSTRSVRRRRDPPGPDRRSCAGGRTRPRSSACTAADSWSVAPAALAACARPPTSAPGSMVPPGTVSAWHSQLSPSRQHGGGPPGCGRCSSSRHPVSRSWQSMCASSTTDARASRQRSTPSRSPAAVPSSTMPPVRPLAPAPRRVASSRTTRTPRRARCQAADSPVKPPPTTATSHATGGGAVVAAASIRHGGSPQDDVDGGVTASVLPDAGARAETPRRSGASPRPTDRCRRAGVVLDVRRDRTPWGWRTATGRRTRKARAIWRGVAPRAAAISASTPPDSSRGEVARAERAVGHERDAVLPRTRAGRRARWPAPPDGRAPGCRPSGPRRRSPAAPARAPPSSKLLTPQARILPACRSSSNAAKVSARGCRPWPVQEVAIQLVGAQTAQAPLAGRDRRRGARRCWGSTLETRKTSSRRPGDGLADDLLDLAAAVHLGRVDVRQPEVEAPRWSASTALWLEAPSSSHVPCPMTGTRAVVRPRRRAAPSESSSAAIELPRGFGLHGRKRCGTRRAA